MDGPLARGRGKMRADLRGFLERARRHQTASLPVSERMNHRLFVSTIERRLETIDLTSFYSVASHYGGMVRALQSTMEVAPARTVKDYENMIARLEATPKLAEGLIAASNEGLKRKLLTPRQSAETAAAIYASQARPEAGQSPLLKSFREMPKSIPEAEQKRLVARAEAAYEKSFRPAWRKWSAYLKDTYAPATRTTLGMADNFNGAELYQVMIRQHTTTRLTAREIHEIGLKEMERIGKEMAAIRTGQGFQGTAEEFEAKVLSAPGLLFKSEAEILAHGRDIAKRVDPELPKLFLKLPRMPYGVEAIPAAIARTAAPHYRAPALDGSRAGYFYLRTVEPEKQSRCCMASLILHEAVPGHHLQIALAREMENVPEFRKTAGYTAFSEGWGLYAEALGEDLGIYKNPHEMYGRLQTEMMRAARLVVDTGVHALGWSRERMIQAMAPSKGGWMNDDFIASEVDRYIAMPAQALAYKIGGLKIVELRKRAERELGAKFDVREFHDVVLRNGGIPLDILEEEVDAWIAAKKK
ncbi:MAG: DUF885 domain-containing protein [Bryobacterales bacterium]|nr:DUF885 domain-containing protein [Bryobacterales bacterium]